MIVLRRYRDVLATDLTVDEHRERGRELACLVQEMDEAEAEEAERRSGTRKRLGELEARRSSLAQVVRCGQEDRETDVEERADYPAGTVVTFRLDTGEVIGERALRPEERQGTIPDILQATAAAVNAGVLNGPGVTVRAEIT